MSPRATSEGRSGGGRVALTAVLVVVIAGAMLLISHAKPSPDPFDPRSEKGNGTLALADLLRLEGATVDVARSVPPAGDAGRVLVLVDNLTAGQRDGLLRWVQDGGVLVVADPSSPLHGGADLAHGSITVGETLDTTSADSSLAAEITVPRGVCDVPALAHLRGLGVTTGIAFPVATGQRHCFGDDAHAFAFVVARGKGFVIGLGDNVLFTNSRLRFGDNSGLATALLAPTRGTAVHILLGAGATKTVADQGTGHETLRDLVRPSVWMALAQLAIAFVIFATARAIRPGRPVNEPVPVPVAGSELVVATGNLMQRARHSARAGWLLRGELYRELCRRYSLPSNTTIADLDRDVTARVGLPAGAIAAVLHRDVDDQEQLLDLSGQIEALRQQLLEGARP